MPINLKVSVGTIKTYPVILGYNALTFEQQTHLAEEQGWYESDFPNPRQERFWVIDKDIFSEEMDLICLGLSASMVGLTNTIAEMKAFWLALVKTLKPLRSLSS